MRDDHCSIRSSLTLCAFGWKIQLEPRKLTARYSGRIGDSSGRGGIRKFKCLLATHDELEGKTANDLSSLIELLYRPYGTLRFSGLPIASRKMALLPFACGEKNLVTSSSKKVSPVEPRRWAYAARYILPPMAPASI